MKHAEADEHHKTKCDKCPFTLVSCQYKDQGCAAKYVRDREEQHMQESMPLHLSLMKSECERLLEKNKEVKCEQMFNTKDEVQKQDFVAGGAKWEVIFYPKGNKAGKGTHLSLYLRLIAAISKVRVKFSFAVLLKNGQWLKLEAVHELSVGGDWGWHKFVGLSDCPGDWLFVVTTMHQLDFLV
jgi:adenine-specific DNA glycosylase